MRLLISGSTVTVSRLASRSPNHLGHLLTPSNGNRESFLRTGLPFGVDNGAYSGFDPDAFRRMLSWLRNCTERCLWVVCPDVVGDAKATLTLFGQWHEEAAGAGAPVAFVGQDGAENVEIPWERFGCWFIGGSTRWKLSQESADLAVEAKRRGKWVHMGRVNSLRRLRAAFDMGCDSVDGSSMSMFGDKYIHTFCRWIDSLHRQGVMFP
jgi:hypothetical protein